MRRQEHRRQEALIKETATNNPEKIVDENVSNSMAGKSDKDTEKLDKPSSEPEEPPCEATAYNYIPKIRHYCKKKYLLKLQTMIINIILKV